MKPAIVGAICLGLIFACTPPPQPDEDATASIRALLRQQEADWNQGNIESFMEGYWKSDSLQFVGRAIALGCAAEHAPRLVYAQGPDAPDPDRPTPIGVSCRLCQRTSCTARSAPPIGQDVLPDEYRRTTAPFGFSD